MPDKSILASKTFWLNALAVVIASVQALAPQPWFDPSLQAMILAVANIGVRFLTSQPVALPGGTPKLLAALLLAGILTLATAALAGAL